jgi:hypothetical protein
VDGINLDRANHFVLRKQHLTADTRINDVVQIVEDIFGLHATGQATPYISLLQRCRNFTREDLDQNLYVSKTLGKIRCVRKTLYVVVKEMIPIAFSATKSIVQPISEKYSQFLGVDNKQFSEARQAILLLLRGNGMIASQVKSALNTEVNISAVLNLMCDQGLLIRGKPQTGWRSNIHTYYRFDEHFPDIDLHRVNETEARRILVRQYIASFGPATQDDIAWWTGFTKSEVKNIVVNLGDTLTTIDGYIVLSSELSALENCHPGLSHTVNMLPSLDPYIMGYKERERYLRREDYEYVFDRSGNGTSTILLDGRVIGVWDYEDKPLPVVKYLLFHEVGDETHREIVLSAKEVGSFIAGKEVQTKRCGSMVPLTRRTAGGVMSPLRNC